MRTNQTYQTKGLYKDFDLGMSRNPLTDDVGKKTDANAVNQSLKTLVLTNFYERPFRPEVGCKVRSLLFELADPITVIEIRSAIQEVIDNYEPRVIVRQISVADNVDYNSYNIEIYYNIIDVLEPQTLKFTLKRLR